MATSYLGGAIQVVLLSLVATHTLSQPTVSLTGPEISQLVSGRSLAISFYGDPAAPTTRSIWDFRGDGSVCARIIGASRQDKCAEEGKWSVNSDMLCWELPSIGRALGTNPACSTAKQTKPDRLELQNQKSPGLTFALVLVLTP